MVKGWNPRSGGKGKTGGNDATSKIKRTVGWYNKHGGLSSQIIYKQAGASLEAIDPRKALSILHSLEEKGATIRDPTAWIKKAAARHAPDLDAKVKKTLGWYNKHGGLAEPIHVDAVKGPMAALSPGQALKILKGLETKSADIKNPTSWLAGAIHKSHKKKDGWVAGNTSSWKGGNSSSSKGGSWETDLSVAPNLDAKIAKTISWYNKRGGLLEPIDLTEVGPTLMQADPKVVLEILKGMDGKTGTIHHPGKWLLSGVMKAHATVMGALNI